MVKSMESWVLRRNEQFALIHAIAAIERFGALCDLRRVVIELNRADATNITRDWHWGTRVDDARTAWPRDGNV
jgi:hypothetical protein